MSDNSLNERQYTHFITLLTVSAGLVGVCLTAIGLIGILQALNKMEIIVDELLGIASLIFLSTCILSFLGLRTHLAQRHGGFIRMLDIMFCAGLTLVFISTGLLTWVLI